MKKIFLSLIILSVFLIQTEIFSHINSSNLPEGCGSCHVGHGKTNEPMLAHSEEKFCYQCHGTELQQTEMKATGKLSQTIELANIENEFKKQYRHPVVDGFGHSPKEQLPYASGSDINHAECIDCHNPHQRSQLSSPSQKYYEVSGYSLSSQYLESSSNEYEICFKCHVDRTAVETSSDNAFKQFSLINTSQHPVTKASTSGKSTSLIKALGPGNMMKCSDCHTNDDPDGPKGPHGSNYRFLLSGNYDIEPINDESPYAYDFCYSCHDRSSILANESFPLHREHIVGDPLKGIPGTSCYTCHASHSSQQNNHLIAFNKKAVKRDQKTNLIQYNSTGLKSGSCYLSCHNYAHSPARY